MCVLSLTLRVFTGSPDMPCTLMTDVRMYTCVGGPANYRITDPDRISRTVLVGHCKPAATRAAGLYRYPFHLYSKATLDLPLVRLVYNYGIPFQVGSSSSPSVEPGHHQAYPLPFCTALPSRCRDTPLPLSIITLSPLHWLPFYPFHPFSLSSSSFTAPNSGIPDARTDLRPVLQRAICTLEPTPAQLPGKPDSNPGG